ncbi:dihydrolipoamide acetyltransferase family protein [Deinococcus radiophilus]|uniref:Dihydrolipoamide acetyltransferase component of pyruvate dehydrogenase complex n=1 Tax=Deinococcus radiophilus TaxID=32062 RepID=A0A3S0I695_9DEIO|nr:dihydrolipoamide acetyltransferase family protein [Deinococcus radiophilus]RTR25733.1 2-oxo acid dehydrogenase subunit E2 [Deinococcus radiophilus]UFA50194.1 2-oxo acid dehydrogenase subunit E2 [Deinococcus radiophilus]
MKEVLLPELAESVVEGEILKWMVKEGDTVTIEQPLCEVMTDKVTVELPSPYAGTVTKLLAKEGDVVAVHAAILTIDETGGTAGASADVAPTPSPEQAIQDSGENPTTSDEQLPQQAQEERSIVEAGHIAGSDDSASLFKAFEGGGAVKVQGLNQGGTPSPAAREAGHTAAVTGRVLAVPAARQLAREMGIDLGQVQGSGPNGRIRIADVVNHGSAGQAQSQAAAPATAGGQGGLPVAPVQYRTPKGYEHLEERVPLRGMRRAISNQMQASHLYTVRTLTVDEINMTKLVEFRSRVKDQAAADGIKISYLPFIFKAVAAALKKYPSLNTSFDEATQEIVQKSYYHMGMAVATDAGLTVPVLRDVDKKSVYELAGEVVDLAARAQEGKLKGDELAGSTFSITNIGSIGALFSFPIINVPDAAILGIHSIQKRPIVNENNEIVVAHMMYISLSFDHRLVDGAEAARFCKEVIRLLENPDRLMLEAM